MRVVRLFSMLVLCLAAGCGDDEPGAGAGAGADTGDDRAEFEASLLLNEDCFAVARDPRFVPASEVDFLAPDDAVLGLASPGRIVAIPLRLIAYHRVVDVLWGQRRLLITYAPLQDRAVLYELPKLDEPFGFGVAGHQLRELLLYDGRKKSLWLQKSGECIDGWRKGETLEQRNGLTRTTWNAWRTKHPTVQVMAPVEGMQDRYPKQWPARLFAPGLDRLPARKGDLLGATWLAEDPPPTIDDPTWIGADAATFVGEHDEVLGFSSRLGPMAVPIALLSHHHAINARFDGEDLVVALCDLCKSGGVYEASVDGTRLTFDLAGAYQGAALLEDRQTRSRWSVVTGECVFGWFHGTRLRPREARWTHWKTWLAASPRTRVLADRQVPARDDQGLPPQVAHTVAHRDDRLRREAMVLGVSAYADEREPKAYAFEALREAGGVANDRWGDVPIVVLYDAGTRTAAAYRRRNDKQTFTRDKQGRFVDDQTKSTWSVLGRALGGPAANLTLEPIPGRATQSMWYAWSALHRDTEVWTPR